MISLKKKKDDGSAVADGGFAEHPGDPAVADAASAASTSFKLPVGRGRRGRSFGVDIDGNVVRVVELLDNAVVSYGTYQGHSIEDAFRKFLATRPTGDVTVSWMGPNMHVVRTALPTVPPAALRVGILDAVDESLPLAPGSASIAARLFAGADGTPQVAVTAVERDSVSSLWNVIGAAEVGLVPAPLLFINDGLFLGVRYSDAQLVLVQNGAVLATRPLAIGGLTTMFDRLGGDPARAAERFATVARGGTRLDPDAAAVVDSYSGSIGDEVRRTVDFWARQGHAVPSEVFVHGPGIVLPNLSGKLLDAALFARPVALPEVNVDAIARTERPTAYMALLAAILDVDSQPVADLADPRYADRARKKKERVKKAAMVVTAASIAVMGILAFLLPYAWAKTRNVLSQRESTQVKKEFTSYSKELALKAEVEQGVAVYNEQTKYELAWDEIIRAVLDTIPVEDNPDFESVEIKNEANQLTLTISATRDGQNWTVMSRWLERLERLGGDRPWLESGKEFRDGPGSPTYNGKFSIPIRLDEENPITSRYLAQRKLALPKADDAKKTTAAQPSGDATTTTTVKA
jgi:hypothetical protein